MSFLKAASAVLVVAVIAVVAVPVSGMVDVAANREHAGFVSWLLESTRKASIARQAKTIEVPDLDAPELQLAGINDFDAMCADCHGAPGKDRSAAGRGLNPLAPNLSQLAVERTPAEIYWATRNGIRMTGMPAWSASHDDASLWPVVAFVSQRLPDLDAAEYAVMKAAATGRGHHDEAAHGGDGTNNHGDNEHRENEPQNAAPAEHDHSTHEH